MMLEEEYVEAVKRNSQRLFLIAFSYTKNTGDAEDLMQNTFLKLRSRKDDFNDEVHLDRWLTRVCVNECRDFHRLHFRKSLPLEEAINSAECDKHFDIDLFNAVCSLSKKERLVTHLFYYEDMSLSDISAVTSIKESTIKSILHRSRKKLKAILGDDYLYE